MTAELISGTALRRAILDEVAQEVADLKARHGRAPGLATILVGRNPASVSYVTLKARTALDLGFHEVQETLPDNLPEADLLALVARHNADPAVDGILVQLPLPPAIDEARVIRAIAPDKDVDGFHPDNLGRLLLGGAAVRFAPCTPAGVLDMLFRSGARLDGAEVVVVGRSAIVGRPLAVMLGQKSVNATVTLVHTGTRDMAAHCRRADVLVVAAGKPGLVRADWIKPGATVIDVGVNRVGVHAATGRPRLVGDVDFEAARRVAGKITPVPGGVGPMTIAMLMRNTARAARLHLEGDAT